MKMSTIIFALIINLLQGCGKTKIHDEVPIEYASVDDFSSSIHQTENKIDSLLKNGDGKIFSVFKIKKISIKSGRDVILSTTTAKTIMYPELQPFFLSDENRFDVNSDYFIFPQVSVSDLPLVNQVKELTNENLYIDIDIELGSQNFEITKITPLCNILGQVFACDIILKDAGHLQLRISHVSPTVFRSINITNWLKVSIIDYELRDNESNKIITPSEIKASILSDYSVVIHKLGDQLDVLYSHKELNPIVDLKNKSTLPIIEANSSTPLLLVNTSTQRLEIDSFNYQNFDIAKVWIKSLDQSNLASSYTLSRNRQCDTNIISIPAGSYAHFSLSGNQSNFAISRRDDVEVQRSIVTHTIVRTFQDIGLTNSITTNPIETLNLIEIFINGNWNKLNQYSGESIKYQNNTFSIENNTTELKFRLAVDIRHRVPVNHIHTARYFNSNVVEDSAVPNPEMSFLDETSIHFTRLD